MTYALGFLFRSRKTKPTLMISNESNISTTKIFYAKKIDIKSTQLSLSLCQANK